MNHIAGSSANITLLVRKLQFSKLQADTDYNFGVTICNLTTTRTLLLLKHYCHNWWFRPKMKSLLYIIYGQVSSLQNENPGVRLGFTEEISFPSRLFLNIFVIGIINQLRKWRAHSPGQAEMRLAIHSWVRPKNNNEKINKHTVSR